MKECLIYVFVTIVRVVRSGAHVKCTGELVKVYSRIALVWHS